MPQYVVTSPTGQQFKVTAPEGATQQQILDFAKGQTNAATTNDVKTPPSPSSSALGSTVRGIERGALPAAGAYTGAEIGGAAGAPFGPVGIGTGMLLGGAAGAYYGRQATDAMLRLLPKSARDFIGQSTEQQEADVEKHPYASALGYATPSLLTFGKPLTAAASKAAKTIPRELPGTTAKAESSLSATVAAPQIGSGEAELAGQMWKTLRQKYPEIYGERAAEASKIAKNITDEGAKNAAFRELYQEKYAVVNKFKRAFKGDASTLPKFVFSSPERVEQFRQIVGDDKIVEDFARRYASNELSKIVQMSHLPIGGARILNPNISRSAKAVTDWELKNRGWLEEAGIDYGVRQYANNLSKTATTQHYAKVGALAGGVLEMLYRGMTPASWVRYLSGL